MHKHVLKLLLYNDAHVKSVLDTNYGGYLGCRRRMWPPGMQDRHKYIE
jgi:hypothetical protein